MRLGSIFLVLVLGCGDAEKTSSTTATSSASVDIGNTIGTVDGQPIGSKSFAMMASRKRPADSKALSIDEEKRFLMTSLSKSFSIKSSHRGS